MHIKQIIIQGFKSYKDQTVIEPFSPKHNVIIGRNGSGKSNFFAAIRFVLSDAYTQLGREERQSLLHEGSGSAVMSAYVEIVFDNSDDRFPTGKDELILRRTIGQKKDEYSLDRKNATKTDVMNLLESAGFSRSNPYYIVPQGRVTALTNMKDNERLDLLKGVAGTHVYEARREESIRIMNETDAKRGKIDELLAFIRERLDELEEDKAELQEYREKDRERRCLEYLIYQREKQEIDTALQTLEEQRDTGIEETDDNRERFVTGEKLLSKIDQQLKDLRQQTDLLKLDQKQYEDDRRDVSRQKAKVELDVTAMTHNQGAADSARSQRQQDVKTIQSQMQASEAKLSSLLPKYNQAKEQEDAARRQVEDAEGQRHRLYSKQGRNAKFKSKNERDVWLQTQIADIMDTMAVRKALALSTNEDLSSIQTDIADTEADIIRLRDEIDGFGTRNDSLAAGVQQAIEAKNGLLDQRKQLWREEARLDKVLSDSRSEMDKAERFLSSMMDQNTSRGIAAVRRIKQNQNMQGVYGIVGELFTSEDKFRTAVEVTAGNSLFHYVVDTDETATKLLEILYKEHAGRVTFVPLSRVHSKPSNVPNANDAVDLIKKLTYDPQYEKAMRQIFGQTVVCPNLQVAAQYARSHGVDAITPDGDRSDRKGALSGGYYDTRKSRLQALQNLTEWREKYETQLARLGEIRHELEQKEQEVTRALNDVGRAQQQQARSESTIGPLQQELRNRTAELQTKHNSLEQKRKAKINVEVIVKDLSEQQLAYEAEKTSEFKKALTGAEDSLLDRLNTSIPDLRRVLVTISETRSDLESEKSLLEVELQENLRPRLDQLTGQQQETRGSSSSGDIKDLQRDLRRLVKKIEEADSKLREIEADLEDKSAKIVELHQTQSEQKVQLEDIARAIEKQQKRSEKSMAKRTLLMEKAIEANKNIRDLGALPDDAFGKKYANLASDKAIKRLHEIHTQLKKYSHVNKKAFEQYSNFTAQRETLTSRRTGLDKSHVSIQDLIDHLDQQKDEIIERTFKQVSRGFASIFERLVPAGRGRLIIQRRSDRDRADEDSGDEDAHRRLDGVENYTGVGISVSFNSKHDEQQRIQQLSGGQKSLCALALVFAIQQCDPAPFYLFDEVDANLDAQYRTAVAQLLQEISSGRSKDGTDDDQPAQYICTTFRPEMVHVAEKCYGVSYTNKTSSIDVVSKAEALDFVEQIVGGH